jgi:CelD/BcsL family acetyltransferase involved in cellulose biosynthesis
MTAAPDRPVVTVIDEASFATLGDEWDDLLEQSLAPTAFLTWAWVSSWRATVGKDLQLLVATARRPTDGLLLGIAPMAIERRTDGRMLRYRALQFIGGHAAAADHLDLIVRTGHEDVAAPLWAAITDAEDWDVYALDGLRPGSVVATLAGLSPGYGASRTDRTVCPVLPLPNSWEEYEAILGRKFRQNLRRFARNLERESAEKVTLRTVDRIDDVERTIQDLARFHQDAYQDRGSRSTFVREIVEFHRRVAIRFLERGMLRLYRLDIGPQAAAVEYCFAFGGTVSDFQGGYDRRWSRHGPGRLITSHAIRAAIEEGAHSFDFLRGNEAHKDDWRAQTAYDERIWIPVSPLGRVVVPLRFAARTFVRQLASASDRRGSWATIRRAPSKGLELLRRTTGD